MHLMTPQTLPHCRAKKQRLLFTPPQIPRREPQRQPFEPVVEVTMRVRAQRLEVRVARPRVDGPLELLFFDIDEARGAHEGGVGGRRVHVAACDAAASEKKVGEFVDWGVRR
ncbi:hypothetical protein CMEL01_15165 [Colletotrichum melonis]|uniref:Uncharacterized protein n=1 Tax=Colletotrichum melonis TaxID=1209925 RepID=A0AAI9UPP9_9PEZI|nr:hypothetical protein CMEL01_15165 [Colletotrichum melonis]